MLKTTYTKFKKKRYKSWLLKKWDKLFWNTSTSTSQSFCRIADWRFRRFFYCYNKLFYCTFT